MNTSYDIIVVGAGIAGLSAAKKARELDPKSTVLLVNGEDRIPYIRTKISKNIVTSFEKDQFAVVPETTYTEEGVDLQNNATVTAIDTENKTVIFENDTQYQYGKLILATGSVPFKPEIPGNAEDKIIFLRTAEETEAMIAGLDKVKSAIVYGTGVQGIELAEQLCRCGKKVTLVGIDKWLMQKQLNDRCAEKLHNLLTREGIEIRLETSIESINYSEKDKFSVQFSDGSNGQYDLATFALGIRPNKSLAELAGVETGRGIKVNPQMQTSDPYIYAAGECVELADFPNYGLWSACDYQGSLASTNALGGAESHTDFFCRMRSELFDGYVFSMRKPAEDDTTVELVEVENKETYQAFYYRDGFLAGCVMANDSIRAKTYEQAVREGWPPEKVAQKLSL